MTEVRQGRLGLAVHAARDIRRGEKILSGWGELTAERTRHSLQVATDTHVIIDSEIQLINHSCEPNCGVLVRLDEQTLEIHALRDIEEGEELSTDYASFEYEIEYMTARCECGTPACRGQITGYRGLPPERRQALGRYIADYLRELDDSPATASLSGACRSDGD